MNNTPSANRIHIAVIGRRNAGKSSIINALTGQEVALVSSTKGTTTDPVYKSMELLPLGPVVFVDTAGIDDEGELGELRVQKTINVLSKIDTAIYVIDSTEELTTEDIEMIDFLKKRKINLVGVVNKGELIEDTIDKEKKLKELTNISFITISAKENKNIDILKDTLIKACKEKIKNDNILDGLVKSGDTVVLVMPIDTSAPKGRIILPQQQVLRSVLDNHAIAICTQVEELSEVLNKLDYKVDLVITDSQVFNRVSKIVPENIQLTSFSIIFSSVKGELDIMYRNIQAIKNLQDGDKILICEACTHHRQKDDIGTVKIPRWLKEYTGKELVFIHACGGQFPKDVTDYKVIIHCGGCMITETEMHWRIEESTVQGVPIVNYGMVIGLINNTLERCIKVFNK